MNREHPDRILISGGRQIGGVASFAEALSSGFSKLGIRTDIIHPGEVSKFFAALRNPRVLKILSLEAVFAAPFARRTICIAHGIPRVDAQGWRRLSGILASFKLANISRGVQLVSVSHYVASTLRAIFNIRTDAVIHNPLKQAYLEPFDDQLEPRTYISFVGRLDTAKNLHRILPAVKDFLDEMPGMTACIVGDGNQRANLAKMVVGDRRFEFRGNPDDQTVREVLRRTLIFFSGNEVEGFGISYLEAMTQGCIVAMPGGGGGIEIHPEAVGSSVQLMPLSWEPSELLNVFRKCVSARWMPVDTQRFTMQEAASNYLQVDARFLPNGLRSRL